MAKPKTVTPPPPASGQDYIEMDRIPPRRGNPKEAQRTVAVLVVSLIVLGLGVGLKETVFKQKFNTAPSRQTPVETTGSKETVTDIPTGFTQGPVPIRVRTPAAKAGKGDDALVPSPFGKPNAASGAAPVAGIPSDTDSTGSAGTNGASGINYDPVGMARSATSQPTVSMMPRTGTTDTGSSGANSTYPTYSAPGTSPAGGGYSPTTTTPPIGTGGVGNSAYGASSNPYGTGGTGYNTGTGSAGGGTGSYSGYGSTTGSTTGTTGTGTSTGGYYGAPR